MFWRKPPRCRLCLRQGKPYVILDHSASDIKGHFLFSEIHPSFNLDTGEIYSGQFIKHWRPRCQGEIIWNISGGYLGVTLPEWNTISAKVSKIRRTSLDSELDGYSRWWHRSDLQPETTRKLYMVREYSNRISLTPEPSVSYKNLDGLGRCWELTYYRTISNSVLPR